MRVRRFRCLPVVFLLLLLALAGCLPKPQITGRAVPAPEGEYPFTEIVSETLQLMNREREKSGLASLNISNHLSEVAAWIASANLQGETDISREDIYRIINDSPEFAVTTFSMNQVWATGAYNDEFVRWFAQKRAADISGSPGLRENLLNPAMTYAGFSCLGATAEEDGRETYKMVYVWFFSTTPAPPGLVSYPRVADENISILNRERRERGLKQLAYHAELTELALQKARDMVVHDYFSHESERLGSPNDMILARITPRPQVTAENLWKLEGTYDTEVLSQVAEKAHTGLMNSEGHRKNLLYDDFTHVGVACVGGIVNRPDGKYYQVVLVQLFIKQGR
jgi:uncharacterized protein YkwD